MDIKKLVNVAFDKYNTTEQIYASVAKNVLSNEYIFGLLDISEELQKKLSHILDNKPKQGLFEKKESKENFYIKFDELCHQQQQILSCPHVDEHVLLLAALKGLEELSVLKMYKKVLKEILKKNLHKMQGFSLDVNFIGRTKEIEDIKRVLMRSSRNNVLLVGPSGIGKTTLAKGIHNYIPGHKLYQLYPSSETFIDQIINILSSSEDKKALFLLDEIFSFEATQIKYVIDNAQLIGTANDSAFRKFAAEYPHIISKFEVITLEEPGTNDLNNIFITEQERLAKEKNIHYETGLLEELIQLTKQYIPDQSFPAKGILLLEEAVLYAQSLEKNLVTKEILKIVVSQKTGVPIGSLTELDKKDLSSLGDKLKMNVKGQNHAIEKIAQTIQKSRLGLGKKNRPIGSFLFVGPSGVGKTELAKAISAEVFGDIEAMVRLDMSEFAEAHMVQRLIGSPPGYIGYEEGGQLTNPVKAKPYTLVLLDEIEKAHPRVFDIFLQVLDDGRLTDGQGKKIDFTNTIIVATSNAGIDDILDMIEEGKTNKEIETEIKEVLQDYFRIEFINRFDDIIIFNALKTDALVDIAKLQMKKLAFELQKRNISFSVSEASLQSLAKEAYDPKYGARGLLRIIQENIENKLADMIIKGELKEGQRIEF